MRQLRDSFSLKRPKLGQQSSQVVVEDECSSRRISGVKRESDRSVGSHGKVDDLGHVAVEHADAAGCGAVSTEEHPDLVINIAVEPFEVVPAARVGDVGDDLVGPGVPQFDDGAAYGLVAVGDRPTEVA